MDNKANGNDKLGILKVFLQCLEEFLSSMIVEVVASMGKHIDLEITSVEVHVKR